MKLAWVTDPHLDFLSQVSKFGGWLQKASQADAMVLTGDISEYPTLSLHLTELVRGFKKPIYFVLGNHDYYRGSRAATRVAAHNLSDIIDNLTWLDEAGVVEMTPTTALVGNEGWYDARSGSGAESFMRLTDFRVIHDFKMKDIRTIADLCQRWAKELAEMARPSLMAAAEKYEHVIFATHVPPFREASWHMGQLSDKDGLPWFCNITFGALLSDAAHAFPETKFTVLCGHTHSPGEFQFTENMLVLTGQSVYGDPKISKVFTLS